MVVVVVVVVVDVAGSEGRLIGASCCKEGALAYCYCCSCCCFSWIS